MKIIPFIYEANEIRTVVGNNGEALFVAKDVADILGYSNSSRDIQNHCKRIVKLNSVLKSTESVLLRHDTLLIPESDVWRLIIKSTLPSAEKVEEWIMEEVLPSIRKTGGYVDFNRLEEFIGTTMLKLAHGLSLQQNKRRSGAPLSDSEKELIIALYQDMYSINAISRELGCDRSTVSRFLEQEREDRGVA